jgi:hypothetical protein
LQQLFLQNEPLVHFFCYHSFKEQSQLQTINATIGGTLIWKSEAALLQPLVPQGEPIAIPVEALEQVAAAVDENKEGTG